MTANGTDGSGAGLRADMDADSNTIQTLAIMTADGRCRKHPEIRLRDTGPDGLTYQRDACPECERELQANREKLQRRQDELDKQLAKLQQQEEDERARGKQNGSEAKWYCCCCRGVGRTFIFQHSCRRW